MNSATCEWMDGRIDGVRSRACVLFWGSLKEVSEEGRERRVRNVIKATFNICIYLALLAEAKPISINLSGQIPKLPPL